MRLYPGLDPLLKNGMLIPVKNEFDRPDGFSGQLKPGGQKVHCLTRQSQNREQPTKNLLRCILAYSQLSCNGCSFIRPRVFPVIDPITLGAAS